MRLDELSPGAQKVVRWMKRHAKEPCRSHSQLVTETEEAATEVSEALGFLSSERKLYSATDPDPEAFDAKIRKLRPEDYRAGEKKWRTIWAWC